MCGTGSDWLHQAAENSEALPQKETEQDRALIIFVKNPQLGKVKTRLARTIGDQAAFDAYMLMLAHTRDVTVEVDSHRAVFYSEYIDDGDAWTRPDFAKHLQAAGDLGTKMQSAFETMFAEGYKKAVIVGSDLLDLQVQHVSQAFRALQHHDFVIGPATDGGYYLLGMTSLAPELFRNKAWSTGSVLSSTMADIQMLNKTVHHLPQLTDIDEEADWRAAVERYYTRKKRT
jgi:uncharacterized protein